MFRRPWIPPPAGELRPRTYCLSIRAKRISPTLGTTIELGGAPKDPGRQTWCSNPDVSRTPRFEWQAAQPATGWDAASPVVVAAFRPQHALQPGAVDPGQLVAHHLALGLRIVEQTVGHRREDVL